ncbi:MAG: hypothetical protein HY521_00665 [Proteobacteria bacterium]|nr:hypothetical protein [Pseudomonadota bacterium]
MPIRGFTSDPENVAPVNRDVENDAPTQLRQELADIFFRVCGDGRDSTERRLYQVIAQSLGIQASGNPYGGYRYAVGRDIERAEWPRVYDLILRVWDEVPNESRADYIEGVNRILAAHGIVWDLGPDGRLHRVLPPAVQVQIEAAFRELSAPRFTSARQNFRDAISAYDDRPRRERDTCANIMDTLESVAKEIFAMPRVTFGDVLNTAHRQAALSIHTISVLQKLYAMANNHFRHGMTTPFQLNRAEVDFVFVSCLAGILLFVRLPLRR